MNLPFWTQPLVARFRKRRRSSRPSRPFARPRVEPLEDRTLLSVSPVGSEFLVNVQTFNTQTTQAESRPAVAADAFGNYVVVWTGFGQDNADGSAGIFARRFAADGTPLSGDIPVNTLTVGQQSNATVATDPFGNFVVVWQADGQEVGGLPSSFGVFGRRFRADGTPLGPQFQVNFFAFGEQLFPSVAVALDGSFVVAWHSDRGDGDGFGVFSRRFAPDGSPLELDRLVNVTTVGDQTFPTVAIDLAGNYVIAWQTADGFQSDIVARVFNANGSARTGELAVNTFTPANQRGPAVATDLAGNFVVAWDSFGQEGNPSEGIFARVFSAQGVPLGTEFQVNGSPNFRQTSASVDRDANGNFLVTWMATDEDGDRTGVFTRHFSATGDPLGDQIQVNSTFVGPQQNASVALDPAGNALVVWSGTGPGDNLGVFAQRFVPDNDPVGVANVRLFSFSPQFIPGAVEVPSDLDVFQFTALANAPLQIQVKVDPTISSLDSQLIIGNSLGQLVAVDGAPGGSPDSLVTFNAVQGETYVAVVLSSGNTTGSYVVSFGPGLPPLGPGLPSSVRGTLDAQGVNTIPLRLQFTGLLSVQVHSDGADTRLSLLDNKNNLQIQSVGRGPGDPDDEIVQHLSAGPDGTDYQLRIEGRPGDTFTLTSSFLPAALPFGPVPTGNPASNFSPSDLVATDLNGDHLPDVAVTSRLTGEVFLFLGNADGTFRNGDRLIVGGGPGNSNLPRSIIVAQFNDDNGDGHIDDLDFPDLAVVNEGNATVAVLLGKGDGTFQPQKQFLVGAGSNPHALVAGDFNRDGLPDLAVSTFVSGDVRIFLGSGDGTFNLFSLFSLAPVSVQAGDLDVADFNEDGRLDLVVTNFDPASGSSNATVLFGDGFGGFLGRSDLPVGLQPAAVAARDLDSDHHTDLAVVNAASGDLFLLMGDGQGNFFNRGPVFTFGGGSVALTVEDLDGDGSPDIAAALPNADFASVLLNDGHGNFHPGSGARTDSVPFAVAAADFNGDGRKDLVTANNAGQSISVSTNLDNGVFSLPVNFTTGNGAFDFLAGDVDGDGHLDLLAANGTFDNVTLLLGLGDGTFRPGPILPPVGDGPYALLLTDLNGDPLPDLVVVAANSNDVSVLFNAGGGFFVPGGRFPTGGMAGNDHGIVAAADFDGDRITDLAVANGVSNNVSVLLGNADGSFQAPRLVPAGTRPGGLVAGDFNEDNVPDLVVSNVFSQDVSILIGKGGGTFQDQQRIPIGTFARPLVAADFNGDNHLDLAVGAVTGVSDEATILLGDGQGGFTLKGRFPIGFGSTALRVEDFNEDGILDLASVDFNSASVSVVLGVGDGSFQAPQRFRAGTKPRALASGDFDEDGHADLAAADPGSATAQVLLGLGDGTFQTERTAKVGAGPIRVVTGDFNRDGRPDLASANVISNDVSVLLGNGDNTFQVTLTLPAGTAPTSLVQGDFNGDGRLDLVTANSGSADLSVFLGNGDGTFHDPGRVAVGGAPRSLAAADFDGDGNLDLVVTIPGNGGPSFGILLLGNGDGSFQVGANFPLSFSPTFLLAADIVPGGPLELATVDPFSDFVSLYRYQDGTFTQFGGFKAGSGTVALAVANLNGDLFPDLVTANRGTNNLSVYLGDGTGQFFLGKSFFSGDRPQDVLVTDLDGDGVPDLASADSGSNTVSVFLLNPDGTLKFTVQQLVAGVLPGALAAADFNADGIIDLTAANFVSSDVTVYQGLGVGLFIPADPGVVPRRATPLAGDFTPGEAGENDPVQDLAVLRRDGLILLRRGIPDRPGEFLPPIIVNPLDPGRDMVALLKGGQAAFATIDASARSLSFFTFDVSTGQFTRTPGPVFAVGDPITGLLPRFASRLAAGDLDGDGRDDLVAVTTAVGISSEVFVYLQDDQGNFNLLRNSRNALGNFENGGVSTIGISPSDLALADLDGDGRLDIIVTNQYSGDVSVLLNTVSDPFAREQRYRAADGLAGQGQPFVTNLLPASTLPVTLRTSQRPIAVGTGRINDDDTTDLVVLNRSGEVGAVLPGNGTGGLLNPSSDPTFVFPPVPGTGTDVGGQAAGTNPTALALADFDGDDTLDAAVLDRAASSVVVFQGDGHGVFTKGTTVQVDPTSSGLSMADIIGRDGGGPDGITDLLVGNEAGDVVILVGQGDGTFTTLRLRGQSVPFVTTDLDGDGFPDVISANEAADRVEALRRQPDSDSFASTGFVLDASQGVVGPANIQLADLNRDGLLDQIVANSSGNTIEVLLRMSEGTFAAPQTFFVGSSPAGITVAQLNDDNGDGLVDASDTPDLVVANRGSNDVSVLFGQLGAGTWTMTPGPRLAAGVGPMAVMVQDVDAQTLTGNLAAPAIDGIPDLLVTNADGSVTVLPGIGRPGTTSTTSVDPGSGSGTGFFQDTPAAGAASFNPIGQNLTQVLVQPGPSFAVTDSGAVFRLDFTNAAQPAQQVFTSTAGNEVRFLAPFGPIFFAGRDDNSISRLGIGLDGSLVETQTMSDARLTDLSTLQVVLSANGLLEIYATNAGNGTPLVLPTTDTLASLGLTLDESGLIVTLQGSGLAGQPSTVLSALDQSGLRLVALLLSRPVATVIGGSDAGAGAGDDGTAAVDENGFRATRLDLFRGLSGPDGSFDVFWVNVVATVNRFFQQVAEEGLPIVLAGETVATSMTSAARSFLESLEVEIPDIPASVAGLPREILAVLGKSLVAVSDEVRLRVYQQRQDRVGLKSPETEQSPGLTTPAKNGTESDTPVRVTRATGEPEGLVIPTAPSPEGEGGQEPSPQRIGATVVPARRLAANLHPTVLPGDPPGQEDTRQSGLLLPWLKASLVAAGGWLALWPRQRPDHKDRRFRRNKDAATKR
jgi:FG-GAP-like repeat